MAVVPIRKATVHLGNTLVERYYSLDLFDLSGLYGVLIVAFW